MKPLMSYQNTLLSLENCIRGNKIWGLPKVVQEIDIYERNGNCITVAIGYFPYDDVSKNALRR